MALPVFTSKQLTACAIADETNFGELATSGYEYLTLKSLGVAGTTTMEKADEVSGRGEQTDAEPVFRAADLDTPYNLRAIGNHLLLAAAQRDTWAAAVTVIGSSNIAIVLAGTHQDGTTGPQIQAPTGTFDDFVDFGGATANGIECLLIKLSGSAQTANNRVRRAKAVWNNTTVDCIDIFPQYHLGAAGMHGEPMVATASESITITCGEVIRNRTAVTGTNYSKSIVWRYANGLFGYETGCVPGAWEVNWDGQKKVMCALKWMGRQKKENLLADPVSGGWSPTTPAESRMITAGPRLLLCSLIPYTSTDAPINLSGAFVTGVKVGVDPKNTGIDNASGTDARVGVVGGEHMADVSLNYTMGTDALNTVNRMTALGEPGTAQRAMLEFGFRDADTHEIYMSVLGVEWEQVEQQPSDSSEGPVTGSIKGAAVPYSTTSRTFVAQRFLAS